MGPKESGESRRSVRASEGKLDAWFMRPGWRLSISPSSRQKTMQLFSEVLPLLQIPYSRHAALFFYRRFADSMDMKAENSGGADGKKIMSPCDVKALKKCLEENKGDYVKCQAQIEAFKASCSIKKPN